MAAKSVAVPAWRLALQRWMYNHAYFPQLGMMRDDARAETPVVREAVRRLPDDVYDQRLYRMSRALQLSGCKKILPKEEWMTLENDVMYLKPYIEDVEREITEKRKWNSQ